MVTYYAKVKNNVIYMKSKVIGDIELEEDMIQLTEEEYENLGPSTVIVNEDGSIKFEPIVQEQQPKEFNVYLTVLEEVALNLADIQLEVSLVEPLQQGSTNVEIVNKINEIITILGGR